VQQFGEPQKQHTEIPHVIFGLDLPREERRKRISERLQKRLKEGMVEEVQRLLAEGIPEAALIRYGLEYKFTCEFLNGTYSYDAYVHHLEVAIQQYAKRQMTWFRKMEKDGFRIHWLNALEEVQENVRLVVSG
jgi:tRNA dimethylallyltransferase